jgi:hypothetical protein
MFKKLIPVIIMALLGTNTVQAATAFDVGAHGPLATLSLKTGHNHKPNHKPHPHPRPRPMPHAPTKTQVIVGGIVTGVIVIAVVTVVLASNRHAQEDSSDQDTPKPRGDTTESETEAPENKPPKE